ncbi:hypothetical protein CYMTET_47660, partial [Cymbomonas tetramitiformis]
TIASPEVEEALAASPIDPPTIRMTFGVNDSPLAGLEGTQLTGSKLGDRLKAEAESNVSIKVSNVGEGSKSGDAYEVQGRGELQLGVLIETMRREGFEMSISPPVVIYRTDEETGAKMEPIEEVVVELEEAHCGAVIEALTLRKAELVEMVPDAGEGGRTRLVFMCPSRGLLGYRGTFATTTQGTGIMHRSFNAYEPMKGTLSQVRKGVIISMAKGATTLHALGALESRGVLFVDPQVDTYEGMIIGEHSRDGDLEVNPCKEKKLTNMRASGTDETIRLTPPRRLGLEEAMGYVASDEMIEVTPSAIRLRKRILSANQRKRAEKK